MFELTKQFRFEAAHTLTREIEAEASRRIHGHSYRAEVVIAGERDPRTGMVADLGALERTLDGVRHELDHRFLDDVEGLGSGDVGEPRRVDLGRGWRLSGRACVGWACSATAAARAAATTGVEIFRRAARPSPRPSPLGTGEGAGRCVLPPSPVFAGEGRGEGAHTEKYFALGLSTTIALVDCSGCSCHSSDSDTPMRPASSKPRSGA